MPHRLILHTLCLATVLFAALAPHVLAYDAADTLLAIEQTAEATGVAYSHLYRVVGCETGWTFDPGAVGDHGTSFGAVQLHRGGGELPRFYALGYDDPFNPYQAVAYLGDAINAGRARAWSCR